MADDLDPQAHEPAAEPEEHFRSDADGMKEAAATLRQRRDEQEAAAPPPPDHNAAKAELERRVADRMGVPAVDIDRPELRLEGEVKARDAAEMLRTYRQQRDAELAEIVDEQRTVEPEAPIETTPDVGWQQAEVEQQAAREQQSLQEQHARQQVDQAIAVNERALAISNQQLVNLTVSEMPELVAIAALAAQNPALGEKALAEFAQREPAKFARFQQLDAAWRSSAHQAQQIAAHRQTEQQQQFRSYAKQQDDRFTAMHPDMNDRQTAYAVQQDAIEYLKAKGLTEERMAWLYHNSPEFRSAEAQSLLYDAVKAWRGQKAMKDLNSHRKPLPPVQRPGVSQLKGAADEGRIAALSQRLGRGGTRAQLSAAAEMLVARRAAAARR